MLLPNFDSLFVSPGLNSGIHIDSSYRVHAATLSKRKMRLKEWQKPIVEFLLPGTNGLWLPYISHFMLSILFSLY